LIDNDHMADGGVLATDPGNDSIFWSGGKWYYMSNCVSLDEGWSWTRYNLSPYEGWTYTIAVDPTTSNIVYSGGIPCVYRTIDFGQTWTACSTGITGYANDIEIFPLNPTTLFAATGDGVFMSSNSGTTWINKGCTDVNALLLNRSSVDTIYAATDDGVWKTLDGVSWTRMGLDSNYVRFIDEYPDTYIYAATYGSGVFRWALNVGIEEYTTAKTDRIVMSTYPNPFSRQTSLEYCLPSPVHVRVMLYDASGQYVATLINTYQAQGQHITQWNGQDARGAKCAPGIYFYRLITDHTTVSGSIIYLH
jgi:hypothetical protein